MTARFISSVLRGRSSALVALALAASVATTAQAATIFTSALYNVTPPGGAQTGNNFQIGYSQGSPVGAVAGISNTSTGGVLGYNFVFAEKAGTNPGDPAAVAAASNTIGAWGNAGIVKLDSATVADPFDTQDHGAFLALDSVYQKSAINIAINTIAGDTYTVTFDWAGTQQTLGLGSTTDWLTVGLTNAGPTQDTAHISVTQQGFTGWFQVSDTFTATATGSQILSFLASGTPTGDAQQPAFTLLDNIKVSENTPPPPSTVPEPSSLMLLSTGLIGLGGFIRSRYSKS